MALHCASCPKHTYSRADTSSHSDPNEQQYFWNPQAEGSSATELLDTPIDERNYIEPGGLIRVRVDSDEFHDDEPGPPRAIEGVSVEDHSRRPPYQIYVRCVQTKFQIAPLTLWLSVLLPHKGLVCYRGGRDRNKKTRQWTIERNILDSVLILWCSTHRMGYTEEVPGAKYVQHIGTNREGFCN